jgi:hypothetical protein
MVIIREAMAGDIANMVKDYRSLLARSWAQHTADLLQVEAERLGGAEQDGAAGGWHIEALGDHINGHQDLHQAGAKVCNDLIAVGGGAKE